MSLPNATITAVHAVAAGAFTSPGAAGNGDGFKRLPSFCRIADHAIRAHEPVAEPDGLIVQDATLLNQVDVFGGLPEDGYALINSSRSRDALGLAELRARMVIINATQLAREHLGRPLPNAVLLGGFAALTRVVSLQALSAAIDEKFPGALGERNIAAATAAYEQLEPTRA